MNNLCPCGSTQTYTQCCQRFHSGQQHAETAEQLMRSRFSAFYQGAKGMGKIEDYLAITHHPSQRHKNESTELQQSFKQQQWLSLKILKSNKGQLKDTQGQVEFVAFFQQLPLKTAPQQTISGQTKPEQTIPEQAKPKQLHECSNFVKENGKWFYVDGEMLEAIKLGRNEPCWCGSRKKLKQCHGK